MNIKENRISGYLYVLISAVCFSLAGILIKKISWSSLTINGVRNLIAFIVMTIYLIKKRHKIIINKVVILGAICNLFMNLTFVMATKMTTAANAIVLQFTQPIFLILFLVIFWKQRPDKKAILTCFFVLSGVLCFFIESISFDGLVGNILAILSGALYAIVFLIKKMKNADFESSIFLSQIISFIVFIPWYMKETDASADNFLMVVILGVVQMGIAYVFLAIGLNKVSPVAASLTSTIEPVLNPIWVALFYGEKISLIAIAGAAIVIISSTVYNVVGSRTANRLSDK